MPNKENIKLWIEDLETTEDAQTTGTLVEVDFTGKRSYCCLGRACVAAKANGVKLEERLNAYGYGPYVTFLCDDGSDDTSATLPQSVKRWLGFDVVDPVVIVGNTPAKDEIVATYANDQLCYSFKQIAAELRKTYNIPKED